MKINFILPRPFTVPSGGYRIVYEYAQRLACLGHDVTVYHSILLPGWNYTKDQLLNTLLSCIRQNWPQPFTPPWFTQSLAFDCEVIPEINDVYIRAADVTVATAWATAEPVAKLTEKSGKKAYLIQDDESIGGTPGEIVHRTYQLGLANIVIAKWLGKLVESCGAPVSAYIPNGLDFNLFRLLQPIEKRQPFTVGMVYRSSSWKRAQDGIQALQIAKQKVPQLTVTLISTEPQPAGLPAWVRYVHDPAQQDLVELYNEQAIFLSSSLVEGFGLPGAEALACGCALATTDSKGVLEYAWDGRTALVSPPGDPQGLGKNLIKLLQNQELRISLAKAGQMAIQAFSWEAAVRKFDAMLETLAPAAARRDRIDQQRVEQPKPQFSLPRERIASLERQAMRLPLEQISEHPEIMQNFLPLGLEYRRRFLEQYLLNTCGNSVQQGIFAGMKYFPQPIDRFFCPKLLGTYKLELQNEWKRLPPVNQVLVVGGLDGYEAVGLALVWPQASVLVYAQDETRARLIAKLAELNGVIKRLTIRGGVPTAAEFQETAKLSILLLITDMTLQGKILTEENSKPLSRMNLVFKLPGGKASVADDSILQRFQTTHRRQFLWPTTRQAEHILALQPLGELDRFIALQEANGPEPWVRLIPRA